MFIPIVNILFLCLPPMFSVVLMVMQIFLAFLLGFSLREQLSDLRPVFFYAILVAFVQLVGFVAGGFPSGYFSWESEKDTVLFLVKLFAIMQSASLVFKTSTSLELREGIGKLFGQNSDFTNAIAMFLNFIPMVGIVWQQSKRAWFARGGKQNVKMYVTLLPVLFSVGMKKAYNAARAVSVRR
ncbi:MAG: hypothetical protein MJ057_00655 [Sphaerochaetaceae bacterium]|nr:hypothetical protein [Sphaerochaetaceae bacterium]